MKKLILFALMSTTGCAAMRAAQAKDAAIEHSVTAFTYQKPCNDVWASARTMLFGRDYQVKSADAAAGLTLETEWKSATNGTSARYLFQGAAPAPGTCTVNATKAIKSKEGNTSMVRDWRMEWDLIKQVDIASATDIEQKAGSAGEAARNAN